MNTQSKRRGTQLLLTVGAVVATFAWTPAVMAEDIETSSLSSAAFRGYVGEWVLTIDIPDNPTHLLLNITSVKGKLAATIQASAQTQHQVITDITESSLALKMRYTSSFGEAESAMVLNIRTLDSATLTGSISDELGLLAPEFEVSSEAETLGLGLYQFRVSGHKGGKLPGRALLDLNGNVVKISYVEMRAGSDDHKQLVNITSGEVFEFTSARAIKLFTDADLRFGDTVVKTENAGANYPGVYSIWLKKTANGWSLLFNEHADVWGTMYESEMDVAEVPLQYSALDEEVKRFTVDLEPEGDGGLLKLAWGTQQWSTPFSIPHYPRSVGQSD